MQFETVKKNLEEKGYRVVTFATAAEATDFLANEIQGKSVGFGGSMTLKEMGVYERLSEQNETYWHWMPTEGKTGAELCRAASEAEVYISSVNGIAESGEIVNIDGNCNRVSAMVFGHASVYLVAGKNKIAATEADALYRARNIAAPKNAQRLGRKTPCAALGERCYDCKSPERICRNLSVLWGKPATGAFTVVLIDETLGY